MNHSPSDSVHPIGGEQNLVPEGGQHPEPATAHPPVEAWIDYFAGKVTGEDANGLSRHLSHCRRCIDVVLDLDAFAEPGSPAAVAVADFEKAAVWRTVKRSLVPRSVHRAQHWPAIAAVAASLLFAVVGLSQRSARIDVESQLAELTQLQPNMQIVDLRPGARERSSGGVDATVDLDAGEGSTLVLHLVDEVDYPEYELRVVDAAGTEVDRIHGLVISEVGNFSLGLAPGALAAGRYELQLFGLVDGREEQLESYPIRLR